MCNLITWFGRHGLYRLFRGAAYRYDWPRFGRTLTPAGESAIEFVVRKRTGAELDRGGRLPDPQKQLTPRGLALLAGQPAGSH